MVLAVQRRVAVRTTASATTPTACVCVSQDTQARHVMSDCVLKDTTASDVIGSVHAMPRTHAGTQKQCSNFVLHMVDRVNLMLPDIEKHLKILSFSCLK